MRAQTGSKATGRLALLLIALTAFAFVTGCGSESPKIDDKAASEAAEAWATRNLPKSPSAGPAPEDVGGKAIEVAETPAPAQPVSLSLTCPEPWASTYRSQRVEFGYEYEYWGKAAVSIDYGDGGTYTTSRRSYLDSAFWHKYTEPGLYPVTATLRVRGGLAATASCSFYFVGGLEPLEVRSGGTWADAIPDDWFGDYLGSETDDLPLPGTGDAALCGDGSLTAAAGRQGACSWHGGLADSGTGDVGTSTYVDSYLRSDGTRVSGYYRSS